jgi:phage gp45-like
MIDAIERIYRGMLLAFGRGRIKFVDDSGAVQTAQVYFSKLETIDDIPVPHDFGFTSNPPADSDAFASFLGGNRKNGIVVSVGSQQYRLKNLNSGEMAIYDSVGQSVYLSKTGIVVNCAGLPMTVNGNVQINGTLTASVDVVGNGTSLHGHTHPEHDGGNTGAPN